MKIIKFTNTFLLGAILVSCNGNNKQNENNNTSQIEKSQAFVEQQIINGFDLEKDLLIDLMMEIPSAIYTKKDEGQYSILYVPKTEETLLKYKDFEKKNKIKLIEDSLGNLFYDDDTARKINEILRKDLSLDDFCVFGRYIPNQYLVADTLSTKGEYSVMMPYEMQIYRLNNNNWQLLKQVVITDIMNYDYYETLSTYQKLMGQKE